MTEDLIHFAWKFRLFDRRGLTTVGGEPLEIISPGFSNSDGGPDFSNVKVKIGDTVWAGNAEAHIYSSDWDRHGHTDDKAYNNVVLHVVYVHDRAVFRSDGTEAPVLELKKCLFDGLIDRYDQLISSLNWIPCERQLEDMPSVQMRSWLDRVLVERMEEKSAMVYALLKECKGSWDDTFYILLSRNFGFKVNSLPFELLARSLPQQILGKHKNNALQLEALIFGQAGFLEGEPQDAYMEALKLEYQFLRAKYKLQHIDASLFKFLRLRPSNFPTRRLAQFSALVYKSNHLFSKLMELSDPAAIISLFSRLPVNKYWETHYRFAVPSAKMSNQLGRESVHNIVLNTVALLFFSYGRYTGSEELTNRALGLIECLPPETNHIIKRFKEIGVDATDASMSQALLQLKKTYCDQKKCLNCAVGTKVVNSALS